MSAVEHARCCVHPDRFATGRGEFGHLCFQCQPDGRDAYPVIVTYTQTHVLWVYADDHAAAVQSACYDTFDKTDDHETLVDSDATLAAPQNRWDWERVYDPITLYYPYKGLECDAHVTAYRRHVRELAEQTEAVPAS